MLANLHSAESQRALLELARRTQPLAAPPGGGRRFPPEREQVRHFADRRGNPSNNIPLQRQREDATPTPTACWDRSWIPSKTQGDSRASNENPDGKQFLML